MTTQIIILAAGMGKRMGGTVPKVLREVAGKPMILHLVDSIVQSGVCAKPIIVIESEESLVKKTVGDRAMYVIQHERLGTGHAVNVCKEELERLHPDNVMVLYGDMPFASPHTIWSLAETHEREGNVFTMASVVVPSFDQEYASFGDFGRVLRDESGEVSGIVEKKDATPEQLALREVNPSFFCFSSFWLWNNIRKIQNDNVQKEYYLTDLVKIAVKDGFTISSQVINNPFEAIGVNTPDQLAIAEELFSRNVSSTI